MNQVLLLFMNQMLPLYKPYVVPISKQIYCSNTATFMIIIRDIEEAVSGVKGTWYV